MESEIEQLKKEIEQLKEENEQLKRRYVPDEKDTQETLMIKIKENTDNYIVRIKCIGEPMGNEENVEDVEHEIHYYKGIPCASVLHYKMRDELEDMIYEYEGHMDLFKRTRSKFIIPKSSCDREELMDNIIEIIITVKCELGWYSEYELFNWNDDSDEYEDEDDDEDEGINWGKYIDECVDECDEECASIDLTNISKPAC